MRIVFALTVLGTMLFLASQGERYDFKLSYDERRKNFETSNAKEAELIRTRVKSKVKRVTPERPRARRLDNAPGEKSIKELMDGFRGLL